MKRIPIILLALLMCSSVFALNKGLSFIRSLVLPGYSQVVSGRDYGYAMMASEAATIGALLYLNNESDALIQESYEYAIKYAHLNPGEYDSEFYEVLARYQSSGFEVNGYNAMIRQTAMQQYPYDPVAQQEYIDTYSFQDDKYFSWDGNDNRGEYNRIRNKSYDFEDYAQITVGVLILNHVVSAVDFLRFSAKDRRSQVTFRMHKGTPMAFLTYKW